MAALPDDNGAGLRALFHGLFLYWSYIIREVPDGPSDFWFPLPGGDWHAVIAPAPQDRQVEITALRESGANYVVLDREDLNNLRSCNSWGSFIDMVKFKCEHDTHAAAMRRRAGIS